MYSKQFKTELYKKKNCNYAFKQFTSINLRLLFPFKLK